MYYCPIKFLAIGTTLLYFYYYNDMFKRFQFHFGLIEAFLK